MSLEKGEVTEGERLPFGRGGERVVEFMLKR